MAREEREKKRGEVKECVLFKMEEGGREKSAMKSKEEGRMGEKDESGWEGGKGEREGGKEQRVQIPSRVMKEVLE